MMLADYGCKQPIYYWIDKVSSSYIIFLQGDESISVTYW